MTCSSCSAASFPIRTWTVSSEPAWRLFSSPAPRWTTSSNSFAPTSSRAACQRPVDIDGRNQYLPFARTSPAHRRTNTVVLENFSRVQFRFRPALRLDPPRRAGAARVPDLSQPGGGIAKAAPGAEYVLPAVLRVALSPGHLVSGGPQHPLRWFRPRPAQAFRLRGNRRLVQTIQRAHVRRYGTACGF